MHSPIGSTEPTSFAGIRCHFFNGRPRSCHQGERCAFSHKSVISVTRRRKEQRFRAAQAAQRQPDGPAELPDLESPTRHSDASKPNAQRTTGGFSNLTWKNSCSSASGTEHAAGATKKRAPRSTSPEKQISPSAPQGRPPIGSSAACRLSVPTDTDRAEGPMSATRPTFSCSLQNFDRAESRTPCTCSPRHRRPSWKLNADSSCEEVGDGGCFYFMPNPTSPDEGGIGKGENVQAMKPHCVEEEG